MSSPPSQGPAHPPVEDEVLRRRLDRGERLVGIAVGAEFTAWLTDAMVLPPGSPVPRDILVQPHAAPEIVAVLGHRLAGPGVTCVSALAAVTSVQAGIAISGSPYPDSAATPPDAIVDNGSARFVAAGPVARPAAGLDLALEACLVEADGQIVDSATGAAVAGHPAAALASAANDLAARGLAIEPGWLVFTGAMAGPVPLPAAAEFSVHFTSLGSVFLPRG
jgi:2-oxo-3-hexenedioate decarboxylase